MKGKMYSGYGKAILTASVGQGFRDPMNLFSDLQFTIEFFTSRPKAGSPNGNKLVRLTVDGDVPDSFIRDMGFARAIAHQHPGIIAIDGDNVTVNEEASVVSWNGAEFVFTSKVQAQTDPEQLTKKEIIAELEAAGIDFAKTATKEQLIELLQQPA